MGGVGTPMQVVGWRLGMLVSLLLAVSGIGAAGATAEPVSFPRGTVDWTFTTTSAGSPTGTSFSGKFHAAGDEQGYPPYSTRNTFHPPAGFRYDTSVPDQCTASDLELQLLGPEACPPGSKLGEGTVDGILQSPFAHEIELTHFTLRQYIFNNAGEQIVLVESTPGYTVSRGKFMPDGSLDFVHPTCFPLPPTGCLDDNIVLLSETGVISPYTRATPDGVRSYATTPPTCPASGYWSTTIDLYWSDGSVDNVVTRQPCSKKKRAP
jgi:hypothetical protein